MALLVRVFTVGRTKHLIIIVELNLSEPQEPREVACVTDEGTETRKSGSESHEWRCLYSSPDVRTPPQQERNTQLRRPYVGWLGNVSVGKDEGRCNGQQ